MAGHDRGALGATFNVTRILQAISLVAVIGMTANFIAEMVSANDNPSNVLVGTLSVVCIAVLYCAITYILFLDNILPFLINAAVDCLVLIAVTVVAVVVGKPLSYMDCRAIGNMSDSSSTASAYAFSATLGSDQNGAELSYSTWIGSSKSTCLEMKSIWGLSIALCILFTFSAVSSVCLWRQGKKFAPKEEV